MKPAPMTRDPLLAGDIGVRAAWVAVLGFWLLFAAIICVWSFGEIRSLGFSDPDDALRIVQVRDWMAGQSWFDVTQYRSQAPDGAPMHWSRLVDLPIAALILLGRLVLPAAVAEQVAVVAVPLLSFLLLSAILYLLTVRVTGRRMTGVLASVMLYVSMGIVVQFRPLRIDHHGWQIVLGALAVLFLLRAVNGSRRYAVLAGLTAALALEIAIEALPLVVAMGGVLGLFHLRNDSMHNGRSGSLLLAYLAALTTGGAMLMLVMLGWTQALVPWCDALSPVYLLPVATATAVLALGLRLPQQHGAARLATLGLAAVSAGLVFRIGAPQCAAGPFAGLDPLVYNIWYLSIAEGLPIWLQVPEIQILLPLPSIMGLVAVIWAIRTDDARRREQWIALLVLQAATFIVSLLVMRSMGMAHLLSLPASAWMLLRIFVATRRLSTPTGRVLAGVAWVGITPVGLETLAFVMMAADSPSTPLSRSAYSAEACIGEDRLEGLRAIPATTLFAQLDIGPHLLAYTGHSVVGTGHHRSRRGMHTVISGFIAPPDEARRIMTGTGATHLVFCAGENETQKYRKLYPASITAALLNGRTPGWLLRISMPRGESIRVYRILPAAAAPLQAGVKRSATPFMQ